MPLISSTSNDRSRALRALRLRKRREATGLFLIEGLQVTMEAVQLRAEIQLLVVAPDLFKSPSGQHVVEAQLRDGVPYLEVTAEVFQSLAGKDGFQGVAAVVRQRWEHLPSLIPRNDLCWVALDSVSYPGNLGTIVRTCDAVGAAGIILLGQTSDPYDPVAVRASTGAIFSQRLVRTTFAEFAAWKQRHQVVVAGTSPDAPTDYRAVTYRPPLVLLMGSERHGLSSDRQALCDVIVKIPMVGRSDSLNLAVATGIMLYAIFDQQSQAISGEMSASTR